MEIRRMWEGGPVRQWSEKACSGANHYYESPQMKGYAGAYVCDRCKKAGLGVYYDKGSGEWICGTCRGERGAQQDASGSAQTASSGDVEALEELQGHLWSGKDKGGRPRSENPSKATLRQRRYEERKKDR
jgi:hypothetical protein